MDFSPSNIQDLLRRIESDCQSNQFNLTERIVVVMLYGSRFRDTYRASSDIDLLCFASGLSESAPIVYHGKVTVGASTAPLEYRIFDYQAWPEQCQYYPNYMWRLIGEADILLDRGPGEHIQAQAQERYENYLQQIAGTFFQENLTKQLMLLRYFFHEAQADIVSNVREKHLAPALARLLQLFPYIYSEASKFKAIQKLQADQGQLSSEALSLIAEWDLCNSLQTQYFRSLSIHRYPFADWYTKQAEELNHILEAPNEDGIIKFLESLAHRFRDETGETLQDQHEWWMVGYG